MFEKQKKRKQKDPTCWTEQVHLQNQEIVGQCAVDVLTNGSAWLYDLSIHHNGRVLNVSFALDHPQLQLCRAGPLARAGRLWTNRETFNVKSH